MVVLSAANLVAVCPLTSVKLPPMYTVEASGDRPTALTSPFTSGSNDEMKSPVQRSTAAMYFWATVDPLYVSRIPVKLPPMNVLLPPVAIEKTLPTPFVIHV